MWTRLSCVLLVLFCGCSTLRSVRDALDEITPTAEVLREALITVSNESALTMAQVRETLMFVQDDIHLTATNAAFVSDRITENVDRLTIQAEKTIAAARGETVDGRELPWKTEAMFVGSLIMFVPFVFSRATLPKLAVLLFGWASNKVRGNNHKKTSVVRTGGTGRSRRVSKVRRG